MESGPVCLVRSLGLPEVSRLARNDECQLLDPSALAFLARGIPAEYGSQVETWVWRLFRPEIRRDGVPDTQTSNHLPPSSGVYQANH
jgi:hypothetical protein